MPPYSLQLTVGGNFSSKLFLAGQNMTHHNPFKEKEMVAGASYHLFAVLPAAALASV